jgi:hypothetical protein
MTLRRIRMTRNNLLFSRLLSLSLSIMASSVQADASPAVEEGTIGVEPYQGLFVNAGVDGDLPQVLVYGPSGKCLGTLDHSVQGRLQEAVAELIDAPRRGCETFVSNEFGSTGPSARTGPGRITVQLLVFDGDFCPACKRMEAEFRELAESDPSRFWRVVRVSLESAFNPTTEGSDRDCATCPKHGKAD